ncbi:MAG TPA: hypothetical protein VFY41_01305 [Nitrososphaeraceae archaeon]|nr:hypothetical protein [Nitrososphaeraceae archaeon]HEX6027760.1 hypothetical protein [Nitrososphaeraceae archaeon]
MITITDLFFHLQEDLVLYDTYYNLLQGVGFWKGKKNKKRDNSLAIAK